MTNLPLNQSYLMQEYVKLIWPILTQYRDYLNSIPIPAKASPVSHKDDSLL